MSIGKVVVVSAFVSTLVNVGGYFGNSRMWKLERELKTVNSQLEAIKSQCAANRFACVALMNITDLCARQCGVNTGMSRSELLGYIERLGFEVTEQGNVRLKK